MPATSEGGKEIQRTATNPHWGALHNTPTLATSEQLSTLEPTRELYIVISELSEKRMVKEGARGVHPKYSRPPQQCRCEKTTESLGSEKGAGPGTEKGVGTPSLDFKCRACPFFCSISPQLKNVGVHG